MITAIRSRFNQLHTSTQLFVLLCLLNYWDFLSTQILVYRTGYETESNPFLYYLMVEFDSVYAILIAKIVVLSYYGFLHSKLPLHNEKIKIMDIWKKDLWLERGLITLDTMKIPLVLLNILFFVICVSNMNLVLFY